MILNDFISQKRIILKENLEKVIKSKKKEDRKVYYFHNDTLTKYKNFATRGKLLRGVLTLGVIEMFGGVLSKKELDLASAIEIIHSTLLIHDDIMDRDSLRRGEKTFYAQYVEEGIKEQIADSNFYGIGMGLCSGDIGYFLAFELLATSLANHPRATEIQSFIFSELRLVGSSQMSDFHYGQGKEALTVIDITDIYRFKSARYTFSMPIGIGCYYQDVPDNVRNNFILFGELLGIVFQIKDDEIGLFGKEEEIGKPVGSDIRENKKTIFRSLLYEKASKKEKEFLDTCFGNANITLQDIEKVKSFCYEYKIIEEVEEYNTKYINEATKILENIPIDEAYKKIFREFIDYNLGRKK